MRPFPHLSALALALLLHLVPGASQAQRISTHPDSARLVTSDIVRFWKAFDLAGPHVDSAALHDHYLRGGSAGLADFTELRIRDAGRLAAQVRRTRDYYAAARAQTLGVRALEPEIRRIFRAMHSLYPQAVFPDVYFLIGRMNSGGTVSPNGLLIGTEMLSRTPESPMDGLHPWYHQNLRPVEHVPLVVAHELVHYQQTYGMNTPTLLAQSIKEGVADFIGGLLAGAPVNPGVIEFGLANERALWEEFSARLADTSWTGFIGPAEGRPSDLGYWIGSRIAEAYYERAGDKPRAIRDMLTITDFEGFLQASGYAGRSAPR